jgi:hypothetical protein
MNPASQTAVVPRIAIPVAGLNLDREKWIMENSDRMIV